MIGTSAGIRRRAAGASPRKAARMKPRAPTAAGPTLAAVRRAGKAATEARKAERWEEAIDLYGKAVKLRPTTPKVSGTRDRVLLARPVRRVPRRVPACHAATPKNGAAYAFLGLCEFGLKDYDRALQHLVQSRILGVGDKGTQGRRPLPHGDPHDAHRAVRPGDADAGRVRRGGERQPADHRGHGHRDAAHGDAAERSAA